MYASATAIVVSIFPTVPLAFVTSRRSAGYATAIEDWPIVWKCVPPNRRRITSRARMAAVSRDKRQNRIFCIRYRRQTNGAVRRRELTQIKNAIGRGGQGVDVCATSGFP